MAVTILVWPVHSPRTLRTVAPHPENAKKQNKTETGKSRLLIAEEAGDSVL